VEEQNVRVEESETALAERVRQLEAELAAVRQELEAAHEKQRRGDETFRRFSDSGILGIGLFRPSGAFVFGNEALLKLFGCSAGEMAAGSEAWDQLTPPEWADRQGRAMEELESTGHCAPHEREFLRRDGTRFWGLFTGVRMADDTAVAFLLDVTERRRAEQAVSAEREWLHVTLSSIGDGVIATDQGGSVLFMNPVAERLTGWTEAEAKGRPLEQIFAIINEDSRQPVANPVSKVLAHGLIEGLANHTLLIARDGTERPIDDCAAPIRQAGGALQGVVLIFHDVTERRQMERQLEERARRLAETDRRKDEFLAILAHELRNPLAPVRNALHLLRQHGGDAKGERLREMMERQVDHMARLVDDLLEVSRITRGTITLDRQRLEVGRVVRWAAEAQQAAADAAGVTLALDIPLTPVWVCGDETRLAQVLANLLENALKFTERGGSVSVALTVDSRLWAVGSSDKGVADAAAFDSAGLPTAHCPLSTAVLTVTDTGIGIEPELVPHLFESFAQADRSLERSRGGLGLGLAMVKGLVELHAGTVTAASAGVGAGARFTVVLPLEPELSALSDRPPPPAPARVTLRVLVVEDNWDAAESLRMLLESFAHEVTVARTGPEGVEAAARVQPDVVLCDIGLPGMDGYAVATALRQNPSTTGMRLVAVTGYGQEEDRRRAREAGFDEHLVKPVDPERLLATLAAP
jgi:PAS domain S-box-containing protein